MSDLLLELRSEEIPARMQAKGAELLRGAVESRLRDRGLYWETSEAFATPRRLALIVRGLPVEIPKSSEERRGPRVDAPDKAVAGFLRSTGLTREQIKVRGEGADATYFAVWDNPAQPLHEVLAVELSHALYAITWPKSMRWGRGNFRWIRPLRSILCIVDDNTKDDNTKDDNTKDDNTKDDNTKSRVVKLAIEGIPCGRVTRGHPYMAPGEFTVESVKSYEKQLGEAKIILRAEGRRERIRARLEYIDGRTGLKSKYMPDLLDEIVGLVEWPMVYVGKIDGKFSDLPNDLLHVSMRKHQKFISLFNEKSERIEKFAGVADIQVTDSRQIEAGYERVLRARLADAEFFWENDKRTKIKEMRSGLSGMVFHSKLGDMEMRTERISKLAKEIASHIGESPKDMLCAGKISKADLCSETVREFPELQGIAGGLLAKEEGKNQNICWAIAGQYRPYGTDGNTTPGPISLVLADRADMLWGFFAAGERPTSSRDPYALRRAALAILRTLLAKKVYFSLDKLISLAEKQYEGMPLSAREDATNAVVKFMLERLHVYMSEWGYYKMVIDKLGDLFWDVEDMRKDMRDRESEVCKYVSGQLEQLRMRVDKCEGAPKGFQWISDDLQKLHVRIDKCKKRSEDIQWISDELQNLQTRVHRYEGEGGPKMGYRHDIVTAAERRGDEKSPYRLARMIFHLDQWCRPEFREILMEKRRGMDNLLAAYRRVANILDAEEKVKAEDLDTELCREQQEECNLLEVIAEVEEEVQSKVDKDPEAALKALLKLSEPVDCFFDKVRVNDSRYKFRLNRLRLLTRVRDAMERVANFGAIES